MANLFVCGDTVFWWYDRIFLWFEKINEMKSNRRGEFYWLTNFFTSAIPRTLASLFKKSSAAKNFKESDKPLKVKFMLTVKERGQKNVKLQHFFSSRCRSSFFDPLNSDDFHSMTPAWVCNMLFILRGGKRWKKRMES